MKRSSMLVVVAVALVIGAAAQRSAAAVRTTFVALGSGVPGVLYESTETGPKAQIGVLVMHSGADYLTHSACTQLSTRGYRVLCANTSGDKSGTFDTGRLDNSILEAALGVKFLRGQAGIRKVVLWGHSGGGTLMTAYQSIAENGVQVCQDAAKIHPCPASLAGLPAADGVILGDTNIGLGTITLLSVDPAVIDNRSGLKLNPALDMYNPQNGYRADGTTIYSAEFRRKFFKAEAERNNAIIRLAEDRQAAIKAGKGQFRDDEPFVIPGGYIGNNRLLSMDLTLMSRSRKPWPLVHADGSITHEIIHGRRVARPTENPSAFYRRGAIKTTVAGFLTSYAIRVDANRFEYDAESIRGVLWTSTYASPPGNVQSISSPLLLLGMTGGYEGWASETIHELAKSADKELAFIDGATHGYGTCKPCEKTPGEFGDTLKTTYDYADRWLSKPGRFLTAAPVVAPVQANNFAINGTVQSIDATSIAVTSAEGSTEILALAQNVLIVQSRPATLADIRPNDFVASAAVRQQDGKLHSTELRIFPEAMRGAGEGQRPMNDERQQTMTNATVTGAAIVNGSNNLKVTFPGGESELILDPGVPVVKIVPAERSAIRPGARVRVQGSRTDAGPQVTRITLQ